MNFFMSHCATHHLHRVIFFFAPRADCDGSQAAHGGWKEGFMPMAQSFLCQGFLVVLRGIGHHIHHSFHMTIAVRCVFDRHAQSARHR